MGKTSPHQLLLSPEEAMPPPCDQNKPNPKPVLSFMEKLDQMILDYYEKTHLTNEEYPKAVTFTQDLEKEIRKIMPGARLEIGGSLCNGFGTNASDLDLCLRLQHDVRPQIVKCDENNRLKRPIDISCYNSLPLYNTKLLAKYCEWEPKRLPALGIWVKKWANTCDIGDASEGTLSSYAWMIILIHYLQNCSPPVLPRLQEDFLTGDTESVKCEQWDVYFHEEVLENWSSNTQSVAELFAGFLTYLHCFDHENLIIQIRNKKELTKQEKAWFEGICIEDPFLLSHNLAKGRDEIEVPSGCPKRLCEVCGRMLFDNEENRCERHQNMPSKEERRHNTEMRRLARQWKKEKRNRLKELESLPTAQFNNLSIDQRKGLLRQMNQFMPPPSPGSPLFKSKGLALDHSMTPQVKPSTKPKVPKKPKGPPGNKNLKNGKVDNQKERVEIKPIPQQKLPDFSNEEKFPPL